MKVAIFGFYKYGNFGDDLMAVMFAEKVREMGHEPIVYGLLPAIAHAYAITSVSHVSELVSEVSCVIVGGGGILTSRAPTPESSFDHYRRDLYELVGLIEEKGLPLGLFSIGGGKVLDPGSLLSLGIARVLFSKQIKKVTLRRAEDRAIFDTLGVETNLYPDIVLALTDVLPLQSEMKSKSETVKIGVNLYKRKSDQVLLGWLKLLRKFNRRIEIYEVDTYLSSSEGGRDTGGEVVEGIRYEDMGGYLKEIGSLDLLITCKLHVGVVAIAQGVPAVSWGGNHKSHSFYRQLCYTAGLVENQRVKRLRFLLKLIHPSKLIQSLVDSLPNMDEIRTRASGHFVELEMFLSRADREETKVKTQ